MHWLRSTSVFIYKVITLGSIFWGVFISRRGVIFTLQENINMWTHIDPVALAESQVVEP